MTRCIIKNNVWLFYNRVSFVEVYPCNKVKAGYLMFDNDISEMSKEYILDYYICICRSDALNFAIAYNEKCRTFPTFQQVDDYAHSVARFLHEKQAEKQASQNASQARTASASAQDRTAQRLLACVDSSAFLTRSDAIGKTLRCEPFASGSLRKFQYSAWAQPPMPPHSGKHLIQARETPLSVPLIQAGTAESPHHQPYRGTNPSSPPSHFARLAGCVGNPRSAQCKSLVTYKRRTS